jgi:hypothetical protein
MFRISINSSFFFYHQHFADEIAEYLIEIPESESAFDSQEGYRLQLELQGGSRWDEGEFISVMVPRTSRLLPISDSYLFLTGTFWF